MEKKALLFDNFYFGMSRKDIEQKLKLTELSESNNKVRILHAPLQIDFLHKTWEESFYFDNKDTLREVILERILQDREAYRTVQEELLENGWTAVAVERDEATFDIFEQTDRNNLEMLKKTLLAFENEAIQNNNVFTVYFFPSNFAAKIMKNLKINFWANAIDKAQENFCLLSLIVGEENIKLSFSAPLLSRKAALQYGEKIKR